MKMREVEERLGVEYTYVLRLIMVLRSWKVFVSSLNPGFPLYTKKIRLFCLIVRRCVGLSLSTVRLVGP